MKAWKIALTISLLANAMLAWFVWRERDEQNARFNYTLQRIEDLKRVQNMQITASLGSEQQGTNSRLKLSDERSPMGPYRPDQRGTFLPADSTKAHFIEGNNLRVDFDQKRIISYPPGDYPELPAVPNYPSQRLNEVVPHKANNWKESLIESQRLERSVR